MNLNRLYLLSLIFAFLVGAGSVEVTPKYVVLSGLTGSSLTFLSHDDYGEFLGKICPSGCTCKVDATDKPASVLIYCNNRNFTDVPKISEDLATVKLDVGRNEISVLKKESFESYPRIEVILAYINEIETIDVNTFSGLKYLEEIDLSDNLILYIHPDTFKNNANLKTVILSGNSLVEVSGLVPMLIAPSLTYLDISFCKLTSLTVESFKEMKNLQNLDLNSNDLKSLSVETLEQITDLKSVKLENNRWSCDCNLTKLLSWVTKMQADNYIPVHKPVRCISAEGGARKLWSASSGSSIDCQNSEIAVPVKGNDCNNRSKRDTNGCIVRPTSTDMTTELNDEPEESTVFGNLLSFFEQNSEIIFVILLVIVVFSLTVVFAYLCVKRVTRSKSLQEGENRKNNLSRSFGDDFSNKRFSYVPLLGPNSPDIIPPTTNTENRQQRVPSDRPHSLYIEYMHTRPRSEHIYEVVR